jgi:hypothetical protein
LAEAGYPKGFKTELLNRAVKLPYIDYGVYLITAWKKIGPRSWNRPLDTLATSAIGE